ncbi:PREDICTED: lipoma HMGIC fusion partner-like 2 protein [Priapulus caudatus]|uniref:Lipoma HMGIC fusion partner-like 2 protein n=1 Tax=Priapulus caudatus TaxID=37621 RepID=A0ABM1F8K2_PRICU|nr:PREDICTED: lipoma HMGIC fusion partner-like 2 protein [Priapulus caudatus]
MKSQQVIVTSSATKLKTEKVPCVVIVTCRTLLWLLLTCVTGLVIVAAVMSPQWIVGPPDPVAATPGELSTQSDAPYYVTLGIYNRCTRLQTYDAFFSDACAPFVEGLNMLDQTWSNFWKTAVIFFGIGLLLLLITIATGLLGLCVQAMCKKSLFVICGLVQAIAGLFFIVAVVMYPVGWGSTRVQHLCGTNSGIFVIDKCKLDVTDVRESRVNPKIFSDDFDGSR